MNSEELVREILNDHTIVVRKAMYLTKGIKREAIKYNKKNLQRIFDYKSKQKNNWIILVDFNKGDPLLLEAVHFLDNYGFNAIMIQSDGKTLVHFSAHFLERFNERFLKEDYLSKLDILKRFLPQNNIATYDVFIDSDKSRNKFFSRFKDGIGLGFVEKLKQNTIYHQKTYISPVMIRGSQKGEYDSISEAFKDYWKELFGP